MCDSNSILLNKAEDNKIIASNCISNKFYHIAISRNYYSILQKMKYILLELGYIIESNGKITSLSGAIFDKGSHENIFNAFVQEANKIFTQKKVTYNTAHIHKFFTLRTKRNCADYEVIDIDYNYYKSNFEIYFTKFELIVDLLLENIKV